MNNSIFGDFKFDTGWKKEIELVIFEKPYKVIVKAKAYFEKDGVTNAQEESYNAFNENKLNKIKLTESLLKDYDENPSERFIPKILLIERDGSYAILCDDKMNIDDGIAVCLTPNETIIMQDDYL